MNMKKGSGLGPSELKIFIMYILLGAVIVTECNKYVLDHAAGQRIEGGQIHRHR